ncbi:translation initiation factor IF-3 [Phlebotomus argentipes]|uniref:translation initiation factor IF-3 n=1 Tax=Phlebotomus argentipes TaxID=94469 RepID=UPI002892F6FA|nr:translation initiation factor IF-3 [Phlebotomus argentipes]
MFRLNYHLRCLTHLSASLRTQYRAPIARYAAQSADSTTPRAPDKGDSKNPDKVVPKITLLGPDDSTTVVTMEEAQKISRRRDMRLVMVEDMNPKSQRAIYRLMTNAEFKEEQLKSHAGSDSDEKSKKKDAIKGQKLLQITNKIADHDLQARVKSLIKWLEKNYRVSVIISGASPDSVATEKIFRDIETSTKSLGKIVQKRSKGSDIRFQLHPTPTDSEKAAKVS